jgi:hypothetical protein
MSRRGACVRHSWGMRGLYERTRSCRPRRTAILDRRCRWGVEQFAALRELLSAMPVGEEAVVANAVEAIRQGVHEEPPDELAGGKRHHLGLAGLPIVLPAERDLAVNQRNVPAVADCGLQPSTGCLDLPRMRPGEECNQWIRRRGYLALNRFAVSPRPREDS